VFLAAAPLHGGCGLPRMRAAAPSYFAVEAMPTSQPNVWTRAVGDYLAPPRDQAIMDLDSPIDWAPCEEKKDPVPAEYAVRYVGEAWKAALSAQNYVARLSYIKAGEIPMDPRCLAVATADVRTEVTTGFHNLGADEAMTGVRASDLEAVPYFQHVLSLYMTLATQTNLTLPPVGSEMAGWTVRYFDEKDAAEKRAPADKMCLPLDTTR